MKRFVCIFAVLLLALSGASGATKPLDVSRVQFEITSFNKEAGLLHWRIANHSKDGLFVYNFFLLGEAYSVERSHGRVIFNTAPNVRIESCPPNRVAPFVFLFVRSGGVIEGDFQDEEVKKAGDIDVNLRIAVGPDPSAVFKEAKRFSDSNCAHSPYDAIVDWATFLESSRVHIQ